ncbi:MAG: SDR family NAD(P)-dependent oxidoreductase [Peptococcaceae bacterium]|nr:SDR family NAD(P)-dependent oxidoreductase [Peptococcaceae bacterium]
MELLKGKNVIITGARRGIGRATVETFAKEGANIWACARKPDKEFEAEMKELAARENVWIKPVYIDMNSRSEIKEGAGKVLSEKRKIDALVNIAGINHKEAPFQMLSMDTFSCMFEVNFFAQIQLCQYIVKAMLRQKKGSIINLASIGAIDMVAGNMAYGSSKAALLFATKSMAAELTPHGIRVNAVAPGLIDTDMVNGLSEAARNNVVLKCKAGRSGQSSEVADLIAFLVSDHAQYISGQVIRIDGGM